MSYFLLIIGFVFLVKGADLFVSGSSAVAKLFNIPAIIIGLTIVACGTSLPEAAISVTAALRGANGIAVGNALGSNMFNLLVVLGSCALIKECSVSRQVLKFEYPLSIAAAAALFLMGGGFGLFRNVLSRADGVILLLVFIVFIAVTVKKAMNSSSLPDCCEEDDYYEDGEQEASVASAFLKIAIGALGIIWGGDLVVESAESIAKSFGIDEVLIGLTIVALGTSLPELVISVVAALKGETDIAIGNVIGSNIFNLLLVLGLSATIHPVAVSTFSQYDMLLLIVFSLVILIPLARKQCLDRKWGILMLLMYAGYLAYIIIRAGA